MSEDATSLLPVEIERPIFECAAWQDRTTAHELLLVARRVKIWVEPIVYTVVTLLDSETHHKRPGASSLNRFLSVFNSRPPEFFSNRVTHLCLTPDTSFEEEQAIIVLETCINVENLAYGGSVYTWDTIVSLLHSPRLRRLSIELPRPAPTPEHARKLTPVMKQLTHLDVLSVWPHVAVLDLVPNLTHLALDFQERGEQHLPLLTALCERQTVSVVAFIVRNQRDVESGIVEGFGAFEEVRFIPLLFEPDLVSSDWIASTAGGKDMWWRAEEAVKRRIRELRQFYNILSFHERDD
jgi:hypothetical protein